MMKFKWERHNFDRDTRTTFRSSQGTFSAKSLHAGKIKATEIADVEGDWRLKAVTYAFKMIGRTYIKQKRERYLYTNENPLIYLTILEEK